MDDKTLRHSRHNEAMAKMLASQTTLMRMFRGWSMERLAREAGVSVTTIRQVETGKFRGNPQKLAKIAGAFDVAIEVRFEPWSNLVPDSYDQTMIKLEKAEQ